MEATPAIHSIWPTKNYPAQQMGSPNELIAQDVQSHTSNAAIMNVRRLTPATIKKESKPRYPLPEEHKGSPVVRMSHMQKRTYDRVRQPQASEKTGARQGESRIVNE